MRKIKVTYMSGAKKPDEDGIISEMKYKSMSLDRDYGKLYQSGMFKLLQLDGCPVKLFLFLCETCSDTNLISSGVVTIDEFLEWMERATGKELAYSKETVHKSFKKLKSADLLVIISRGKYKINPVHFWKGSKESDRIDSVRFMLEKKMIKHTV